MAWLGGLEGGLLSSSSSPKCLCRHPVKKDNILPICDCLPNTVACVSFLYKSKPRSCEIIVTHGQYGRRDNYKLMGGEMGG